MLIPEQRRVRGHGCPRLFASAEVRLKCSNYAIGERQPPRFEELGAADLDSVIVDVEIAEIQTLDFTDARTGAVPVVRAIETCGRTG
jgi:hypothetical protein